MKIEDGSAFEWDSFISYSSIVNSTPAVKNYDKSGSFLGARIIIQLKDILLNKILGYRRSNLVLPAANVPWV